MRIIITFLALVISACSSMDEYPNRYFDYSGKDGCKPANIGHRLGGDLPEYGPNTLEGMYAIESMQKDRCFKNWEFDINQSKDSVVLAHDMHISNVALIYIETSNLPDGMITLDKFISSFASLNVTKPVVFDIKNIPDQRYWPSLLNSAVAIKNQHGVDVWFIMSSEVSEKHQGFCQLVNDSFDVMLYSRGGYLCN